MKTSFIICLLVLGTYYSKCQEIQTKVDENGSLLGESILVFDSLSATQIYKSTIEWVSYNFTNSESVIQSTVENKMVRISGISKSIIGPYMGFYFDLSYLIQIDIKDGKLKFNATELQQISQSAPYSKTKLEILFDKNGKLKSGKRYKELKDQIDKELLRLLISLKLNVEGKIKSNEENW